MEQFVAKEPVTLSGLGGFTSQNMQSVSVPTLFVTGFSERED
jgi:hypothetical protein